MGRRNATPRQRRPAGRKETLPDENPENGKRFRGMYGKANPF